ncbi:MAG TPA: molybdopterin-guanine dinucleotide biosynthesis protein MobB, partial [Bacillales bacterium]|nr:molybdopterin-guanine dinucleotide biosynthesis protein MobB [Bacillales bacterium]
MALVKPMIFQVVGYQNSGKTTFITKILKQLKIEGDSVGVIKHHGHGGKPDVYEQKDSARHIENGAIATIVEGNGRLLLQAEQAMWTLQE